MVTFNLAAIRIQALARQYIVRKLGPKWRLKLKRKKRNKPKQLDKYLAYIDHYSSNQGGKPVWLDNGYSTWCAVRIQSWWRMASVTRCFRYKGDICVIAAIEIQTTFRSYSRYMAEIDRLQRDMHTATTRRSVATIDSTARIIQNSWRRYCNMRVYRYFRDLVLHKLRGAPADLLRTIIATESDLLDKAAGVHVRFRLGGRTFPPKIYYKIFTHRALCDVNAFAPRNYCQERRQEPVMTHNKPTGRSSDSLSLQKTHIRVGGAYFESTLSTEEKDDWYRRRDNNPWRVISAEVDDLFSHQPYTYFDPAVDQSTTHDSSLVTKYKRKQKQKYFHYSRLRRQQDVMLARKQKKREWMLKAYMLTAGSNGIRNGDSEMGGPAPDEGSDSSLSVRREKGQGTATIDMCDSFSSANSEDYIDMDNAAVPTKRKDGRTHRQKSAQGYAGRKYEDKASSHTRYEPAPAMCDDLEGSDDALLKWSMALDYEEYSRDWLLMATSMPSDADRELLYNSSLHLNVSTDTQSKSHK